MWVHLYIVLEKIEKRGEVIGREKKQKGRIRQNGGWARLATWMAGRPWLKSYLLPSDENGVWNTANILGAALFSSVLDRQGGPGRASWKGEWMVWRCELLRRWVAQVVGHALLGNSRPLPCDWKWKTGGGGPGKTIYLPRYLSLPKHFFSGSTLDSMRWPEIPSLS